MPTTHRRWKLPFLRYTMQRVFDDISVAQDIRAGFKVCRDSFKPDCVFCLNVDQFQIGASKQSPFGSTPWGGILMVNIWYQQDLGMKTRPSRYETRTRIALTRLLKQPELRFLTTADGLLADFCQARLDGGKKVTSYPERGQLATLPTSHDARAAMGLSPESFVFLSYGWQTTRKGIKELLAALQHPNWPAHGVAVIMGSQRPDAQDILSQPVVATLVQSGKLVLKPGVADDATEAAAFAAADAIWIGYPEFMTVSGVLVQALVAGKPVFAGDHGALGHIVSCDQIGLTAPIYDIAAVTAACRSLATDPDQYRVFQQNAENKGKAHRPGEFERIIADKIEGAMQG